MKQLILALLLAPAGCATMPARGVADSSFVGPAGSRSIQLSAWLPVPPREAYRAFSTVEGWKTWAVPSAFGEVALGGVMETSYNPDAKAGDPANIKQQFLALVPDHLIAFRTVQTPPGFPHPELYMKTVALLELTPEGNGTRLIFTHQGFGTEPGFGQLYDFFLKGNKQTMDHIVQRFETGPIDFKAERTD